MSPFVKPFNPTKYQALMNGLECSEILFSSINLGDRIDAEYFSKQYLKIEQRLDFVRTRKIGEISSAVASAFYPAATQLYSIGDTAFVRCVDCINYPVISMDQDTKFEKIPRSFAMQNSGISLLRRHEIVITKVGTPCYASIIDEYDEVALSRTVLGLTQIKDIDPYYLMAFLRCQYGFGQLYRQRELTIQYQLTLPRVKSVDVFLPSEKFQDNIRNLIRQSRSFMRDSVFYYDDAQEVLLNELRFDSSTVSSVGITQKSFSESFAVTGRLDAEYYQPKYDAIESIIKAYDPCLKTLSEIAVYIFTGQYAEEYYKKGDLPNLRNYIRGTDILMGQVKRDDTHCVSPVGFSKFASLGDIVTGRVGTIGNFGVVDENMNGALYSDNVLCFRLPPNYLPDVYALYFNSELAKELTLRMARGSVQQRLNQKTLSELPVPLIRQEAQLEIQSKVQESFKLRRQAEQLIETAVKAVEIAIERDEVAAVGWLNAETESIT